FHARWAASIETTGSVTSVLVSTIGSTSVVRTIREPIIHSVRARSKASASPVSKRPRAIIYIANDPYLPRLPLHQLLCGSHFCRGNHHRSRPWHLISRVLAR